MTKTALSVVILAKNESGRIRDCMQSVAWADEVLVVDDNSTDDTAPMAESLGARVVRRTMDLEGRHRNWAYQQARHPWVLSVDADERVTPELAQEIQVLLAGEPPHAAYAMPRRNFIGSYWVRYGGWYPSAQLKLFRKERFRYEEAEVHPKSFLDGSVGTLRHDLLHYSYRDFGDFLDKLNRQTTLEASKWVRDGRAMPLGKSLWRAVDRCWRSYVGKQGFRDGYVGLMVAVMAGLYQLLSYAKYRELRVAQQGTKP